MRNWDEIDRKSASEGAAMRKLKAFARMGEVITQAAFAKPSKE